MNRGLIFFAVSIILLSFSVSAFWPFTGNVVEGTRPTITSTSPEGTVNTETNYQISFSFSASDLDGDMNHMWIQVWKAQSSSDASNFISAQTGYNNAGGFYTVASQGVTTASSNTFTTSFSHAGTYYIRFAVRDVASNVLTESWKTIIVQAAGKDFGTSCRATSECKSGLVCDLNVCASPTNGPCTGHEQCSATHICEYNA